MTEVSDVRATNAWGIETTEELEQRGSLRIPELLLFVPTSWLGLRVAPGVAIPLAEVASVVVVVIAAFRPPTRDLRIPPWFMALAVSVLGALLLSAQVNGEVNVRRLGHVAVVVALAIMLASGRVHARSALVGMAVGLPIGVGYGLLFFSQSTYPGRLTGIMADPNTAGMAIVILGCLGVAGLTRRWHQLLLIVVCLAGVWFTFSRTSLLAVAVVAGWLLIGRRLGPAFGSLLILAVTQLIVYFPDEWKVQGRFADREGSDELRERILVQEQIDVARSPWIGNGPGTASVQLNDQTLFFHSSYLGLRAEAGWIGLGLFVALLAGVFWYLVTGPDRGRTVWFEAALIGGLICAMNLGEVLLETPLWIALGLAMRESLASRESSRELAGAAPQDEERILRMLAAGPYAHVTHPSDRSIRLEGADER